MRRLFLTLSATLVLFTSFTWAIEPYDIKADVISLMKKSSTELNKEYLARFAEASNNQCFSGSDKFAYNFFKVSNEVLSNITFFGSVAQMAYDTIVGHGDDDDQIRNMTIKIANDGLGPIGPGSGLIGEFYVLGVGGMQLQTQGYISYQTFLDLRSVYAYGIATATATTKNALACKALFRDRLLAVNAVIAQKAKVSTGENSYSYVLKSVNNSPLLKPSQVTTWNIQSLTGTTPYVK